MADLAQLITALAAVIGAVGAVRNGKKIQRVHVLVNGRLSRVLRDVERLKTQQLEDESNGHDTPSP